MKGLSKTGRPPNDPMTFAERVSLEKAGRIDGESEGVDHRLSRSVRKQNAINSAIVSGFEDQMFKAKSVAAVKAIVQELRTSMIEGVLTGAELIVMGQLLVRGEAKALKLSGIDPDGTEFGYEDRASADSKSNFPPTEKQLAEVDKLNEVWERENNAKQFLLQMMEVGISSKDIDKYITAHKESGTPLPSESEILAAISQDPFAQPVRNTFQASDPWPDMSKKYSDDDDVRIL